MAETETIWGLVLAGGRSRRMGADKALLCVDGETQLARAVALLERHLPEVFVSTRPAQRDDPERRRYRQIVDRFQDLGPIAGILSAFEEYPEVGWLVLACDLPNVDDATLGELLSKRNPERPFSAYRSTYDGLPEPLCAVYSRQAKPILDALLREQITCPRKMLIRSDTQLLTLNDPRSLDNVNTPEDLAESPLEVT